jgi:Glycosyl hydrolase catalytic core
MGYSFVRIALCFFAAFALFVGLINSVTEFPDESLLERKGRFESYRYHNIIQDQNGSPDNPGGQDAATRNSFRKKRVRNLATCPTPTTPPSFKGKKGIGMVLKPLGQPGSYAENFPKIIALKPYWNYSWGSQRVSTQPSKIEFVPMIWGAWSEAGTSTDRETSSVVEIASRNISKKFGFTSGLQTKLNDEVVPQFQAGTAKRLLTYNEPDYMQQSNMAVSSVVKYWPILANTNYPLASPSVAQGLGAWMIDFMSNVDTQCLRMEYIALHWYGGVSAQSFINYMTATYTKYGSKRPLLITEFAPADWYEKD